MRFRRVLGALVVALSVGSCSLSVPENVGTINLYLEVDKARMTVGQESMTITVTARNVGYDPLTLTGPSDCLLYVEVLDAQGSVVWNSNGSCAAAIVTEEIAVGKDKVQSFIWNGSNLAGALLGAGFYNIRAVARVTGAAYAGPPLSIALD